jgi:outer membrane biosynthesis protein TonB
MGGSPAKIVKKVIKPIAPKPKPAPAPKPVAAPKPVPVAAPKPVAPAPAPQPITPTAAEVSQSEATAADGMGAMSRKVKRKGRSATILTSSAGVNESVTLGTKSLLGG